MSGPLFGPGPGVVTPGTPPLDGPDTAKIVKISSSSIDDLLCSHIIMFTFFNTWSYELLKTYFGTRAQEMCVINFAFLPMKYQDNLNDVLHLVCYELFDDTILIN